MAVRVLDSYKLSYKRNGGRKMRRILSACLEQTMRFDASYEASPEKDLEIYCRKLDKAGTKYVIEDKKMEPNGSVVVKIKKQYNSYSTDGYLE